MRQRFLHYYHECVRSISSRDMWRQEQLQRNRIQALKQFMGSLQPQWKVALEALCDARRSGLHTPDLTFRTMQLAAQAGSTGIVQKLRKEVQRDVSQQEFDQVFLQSLSNESVEKGSWKRAMVHLEKMLTQSTGSEAHQSLLETNRMSTESMNSVLKACQVAGKWEDAFHVFAACRRRHQTQKFSHKPVQWDSNTVDQLALVCSQHPQTCWSQSLRLFAGVRSASSNLSQTASHSVLQTMFQADRFDEATRLVEILLSNHDSTSPVLSEQSLLSYALPALEEASVRGKQVQSAAQAYCSAGNPKIYSVKWRKQQWVNALTLLSSIHKPLETKRVPRVALDSTLRTCLTCGQWEAAANVLHQVRVSGAISSMGENVLALRLASMNSVTSARRAASFVMDARSIRQSQPVSFGIIRTALRTGDAESALRERRALQRAELDTVVVEQTSPTDGTEVEDTSNPVVSLRKVVSPQLLVLDVWLAGLRRDWGMTLRRASLLIHVASLVARSEGCTELESRRAWMGWLLLEEIHTPLPDGSLAICPMDLVEFALTVDPSLPYAERIRINLSFRKD